ncbi:MAG TPA: sugar phosphate isomerase/epimerase [Clostridiales bacterium]|nr:sugar phosphate isomerase/epimerase [Clostridiales bacterium]
MGVIIGMNFPAAAKAEQLPQVLQTVTEDGFDALELNFGTFPLILGGEIQPDYLAYFKEQFSRFPLVYTGHMMYDLNFRTRENRERQLKILTSSIDICAELEMRTLTIHYEQRSPREEEEALFLESQQMAAEHAANRGVVLCLENIEVERYEHALATVKAVDHPYYRMNLDLGHLYLSTRYFGGDFITGVKECAPYLGHLHVNDNLGRFEPMRLEDFFVYRHTSPTLRIALGQGDIHIPPFWGKVPLAEAFDIIAASGYQGIFLCEYDNGRYVPFNRKIQERVRREVNAAMTRCGRTM